MHYQLAHFNHDWLVGCDLTTFSAQLPVFLHFSVTFKAFPLFWHCGWATRRASSL